MTGSAVFKEMQSLPACQPIASKMRYFVGHEHCNLVMEANVGFMVGANGMSDSRCGAEYGFSVLDTTGGDYKVYYFPVYDVANNIDNYEATISCIQENGVSGCYHLATLWAATPY